MPHDEKQSLTMNIYIHSGDEEELPTHIVVTGEVDSFSSGSRSRRARLHRSSGSQCSSRCHQRSHASSTRSKKKSFSGAFSSATSHRPYSNRSAVAGLTTSTYCVAGDEEQDDMVYRAGWHHSPTGINGRYSHYAEPHVEDEREFNCESKPEVVKNKKLLRKHAKLKPHCTISRKEDPIMANTTRSFSAEVEALATRAQRAQIYFDSVLPATAEETDSYYISPLHQHVAQHHNDEENPICEHYSLSKANDEKISHPGRDTYYSEAVKPHCTQLSCEETNNNAPHPRALTRDSLEESFHDCPWMDSGEEKQFETASFSTRSNGSGSPARPGGRRRRSHTTHEYAPPTQRRRLKSCPKPTLRCENPEVDLPFLELPWSWTTSDENDRQLEELFTSISTRPVCSPLHKQAV